MSIHPIKVTTTRVGRQVRWGLAFMLALCSPVAIAQGASEPVERFDETSARAHAAILFPLIVDDVIDGERRILRAIPAGGDVGVQYQFRLRPQPVRFRPFCEMQTVSLRYDFAQRNSYGSTQVREFDLLAMKRGGAFESGQISSRSAFLHLSPEPRTAEEHANRCRTVERDFGWLDAANAEEFRTELALLARLGARLSGNRDGVRFRCFRDNLQPCPISSELILQILEDTRRWFSVIRLNDQTDWAQFIYYDEPRNGQAGEMRSLIVGERAGEIVSVTLVYSTVNPVMI